jgi:hypothetical protein
MGTAVIRRPNPNTTTGLESAIEALFNNPDTFGRVTFNNWEFFTSRHPYRIISRTIWSNHDLVDTELTTDLEVQHGLDMMEARGWRDHLIVKVEVRGVDSDVSM